MFLHLVLFWLKDPENKSTRQHFESALNRLVQMDVIKQYHLGVPAGTPREVVDSSYTYSLTVFFDNKEQHDVYQDHPEHLAFIAQCKELWTKVHIIDSVPF